MSFPWTTTSFDPDFFNSVVSISKIGIQRHDYEGRGECKCPAQSGIEADWFISYMIAFVEESQGKDRERGQ